MNDDVVITIRKNKDNFINFGHISFSKRAFQDGKLRAVYSKTLSTITGQLGKVIPISEKLINCLLDISINRNNFNMYLFYELDKKEQDIVVQLIKRSKLDIGFNYKNYLKNRLKVLQAEINDVNNNNPSLLIECRKIIRELLFNGMINKTQYTELLESLEN